MATPPLPLDQLIAKFGPSLNFPGPEGIAGRDEPDAVVKTRLTANYKPE